MAEPCAFIPTDRLPVIEPGEPVPDYSQPLAYIGSRLASIEALLQAQRAQDMDMYPQPGDKSNYYGYTLTVAASAITTVTITFLPDYLYFFKLIHIDIMPNLTYQWMFESTTEESGSITLIGNRHDFGDKPIKAKGRTTLILTVTNTGVQTTADISIQSWGRRNGV